MEIKKVNQVENAIVSRIAASIKSNVTEFGIIKIWIVERLPFFANHCSTWSGCFHFGNNHFLVQCVVICLHSDLEHNTTRHVTVDDGIDERLVGHARGLRHFLDAVQIIEQFFKASICEILSLKTTNRSAF